MLYSKGAKDEKKRIYIPGTDNINSQLYFSTVHEFFHLDCRKG